MRRQFFQSITKTIKVQKTIPPEKLSLFVKRFLLSIIYIKSPRHAPVITVSYINNATKQLRVKFFSQAIFHRVLSMKYFCI